jgi:hypothetical protein
MNYALVSQERRQLVKLRLERLEEKLKCSTEKGDFTRENVMKPLSTFLNNPLTVGSQRR